MVGEDLETHCEWCRNAMLHSHQEQPVERAPRSFAGPGVDVAMVSALVHGLDSRPATTNPARDRASSLKGAENQRRRSVPVVVLERRMVEADNKPWPC